MKSNLHAEHKRMHKFIEVAGGERENKFHVTHHTFCHNGKSNEIMKSNLPSEHKRMHKFKEVASGEREKSTSLPTLCVRMIKRYAWSSEKYLTSWTSANAQVHRSSKRRKRKKYITSHTLCQKGTHEAVKSNLPPEHQQMHKFTEVASGKKEKQISYHSPHFLVTMIKVTK